MLPVLLHIYSNKHNYFINIHFTPKPHLSPDSWIFCIMDGKTFPNSCLWLATLWHQHQWKSRRSLPHPYLFPFATRSLSLHKDYDNNSQRFSLKLGGGNKDREWHGTEQSRVHPEGNTVSAPDECQEFFSGLRIFPENPQHCAGYSFTVHFLYPTHHHAHVPRRNERGVRNTPGEGEIPQGEMFLTWSHQILGR